MTRSTLEIRDADRRDWERILELVNATDVPGKLPARTWDLRATLARRIDFDRYYWDSFTDIRIDVSTLQSVVTGAVCHANFAPDDEAFILWLYGGDRSTIMALLDHVAVKHHRQHLLRAFWVATPLAFGLEGLPSSYFPLTHESLQDSKYDAFNTWRYMVKRLSPIDGPPRLSAIRQSSRTWQLHLPEQPEVGHAIVGIHRKRLGMLHWIQVGERFRGSGKGALLLRGAETFLVERGVECVILVVDHDDPTNRDRRPALRLYESAGFRVVDDLWSYAREL